MEKENLQKQNKKQAQVKALRLFLTVTLILAFVIVSYAIIKITGVWEKINSIEKLKKIVESGGAFSFVVFVIFIPDSQKVFSIFPHLLSLSFSQARSES